MIDEPLIIMPVKDALPMADRAIRAIVHSGHKVRVYDDYSTAENAARLEAIKDETGIEVVHLIEQIDHPSPNYRWILQAAQREALEKGQDLIIIESDVLVQPDTIEKLLVESQKSKVESKVGMVAAVTTDEQGVINFPYEYARKIQADGPCKKRLSFCCTLLTNALLQAYDFAQLDPDKNWYDVHISHMSVQKGLVNILQVTNPVVHIPHSSRPWKQLKYTNPLLYYWRKLTQRRDRI